MQTDVWEQDIGTEVHVWEQDIGTEVHAWEQGNWNRGMGKRV